MTKDEALKLSMEAMEITGGFDVEITAIKEALAQPEQEPVAWGIANTAIIGGKQLMMVRLEIPSGAPHPELWIPLYTKEQL